KPSYVGGILEMANRRLYGHWSKLTAALRTGQPQAEAGPEGENSFAALYADPDRLKVFLRAMTGVSRGANLAIAEKFPWAKYRTVADAGPAQGDLLVQVMLHNPHLMGIGFDLPEVGPIFEEYVQEQGLAERVQFQGGSFFTDPLPRADVITMGHILHDWNLDQKKQLIKAAYDALPDGGAFVIIEALIDDARRENIFGLMMSLSMLIESGDAFDFTGSDFAAWCHDTGFRDIEIRPLASTNSVAIAYK